MEHTILPQDFADDFRFAINKARENRDYYHNWIINEIDEAITLITEFDMVYVLGGLGARLLRSTPTSYNQSLENYNGPYNENLEKELIQEDDNIEVILEYAMNIATASINTHKGNIPSAEDIDKIYEKLIVIKTNVNVYELSAEAPANGNEFDHWLRSHIIADSINVRGNGYSQHVREVYNELFKPHNGFIEMKYGFNAHDLLQTILKLDNLVYSKVANPLGAIVSHKRFTDWSDKIGETAIKEAMKGGKHFMRQFIEANPDLFDEDNPDGITMIPLDAIHGYNRLFWVIPENAKEELIFKHLAQEFSNNTQFFLPEKFKAFPLNDSNLKFKPLIYEEGKYYFFSLTLAYRNIFKIAENLIEAADGAYYQNFFLGNSSPGCRDNYVERKAKSLFEKLLPHANFYHSLPYTVIEDGQTKNTELDILGISDDTVYIIEVKAGELNPKHRRGALKGLKERLNETINAGSYQCHRALTYIQNNDTPSFTYSEDGTRKTVTIDTSKIKSYVKISVTFEYFGSLSTNLSYLINSGILSADYKWTWIVSLYDLMVFADIIETESDFKEYIQYRIDLYDREDIRVNDELDVLGFFLDGNFPLHPPQTDIINTIVNFSSEIDQYYNAQELKGKVPIKPIRKRSA